MTQKYLEDYFPALRKAKYVLGINVYYHGN